MLRLLEILKNTDDEKLLSAAEIFRDFKLDTEADVKMADVHSLLADFVRLGWGNSVSPFYTNKYDKKFCLTEAGKAVVSNLPALCIKPEDQDWNKGFWPSCRASFAEGVLVALHRTAGIDVWGGGGEMKPYTVLRDDGVWAALKAKREGRYAHSPSNKTSEVLKMLVQAKFITMPEHHITAGCRTLNSHTHLKLTKEGEAFAAAVAENADGRCLLQRVTLKYALA